ncbi:MAG: ECF-type sigma factor [Gemmatimonadaceae bacterium]
MSSLDRGVDRPETDALFPLVYDELKRLARHHRREVDARATLCTTELVHEAFFKLAGASGSKWEDRAHFFGAASRAMRQVLVDFARSRQALKRGGDVEMVSLSHAGTSIEMELEEILELNDALDKLNLVSERLRQIVELRYFGGLPEEEIAKVLGVSVRTVARDWLKARLFLLNELRPLA